MKTAIMDHVMVTQFELQYKAVAEFKWSFVYLLEANFVCVNCVMAVVSHSQTLVIEYEVTRDPTSRMLFISPGLEIRTIRCS